MVLEEGYTQVSEYINARTKVKMTCPSGHSFEILPNNWKKGVRCGVCYRESLKNTVVNQERQDLQRFTTPKKPHTKPKVLENTLSDTQNALFKRYLKLFIKLKKDGVAQVDINERVFTLSCRGETLEIWIMDYMNDLHPKDIYPVYLNVSDYVTDEEYIKEWIMKQVRGVVD